MCLKIAAYAFYVHYFILGYFLGNSLNHGYRAIFYTVFSDCIDPVERVWYTSLYHRTYGGVKHLICILWCRVCAHQTYQLNGCHDDILCLWLRHRNKIKFYNGAISSLAPWITMRFFMKPYWFILFYIVVSVELVCCANNDLMYYQ